MYLAIATRPDIAFAVNQAAKFCENPGRRHWAAVKRIFAYLRGTQAQGLDFTRVSEPRFTLDLRVFSDADDAGDPDTRRSVSGYCFYIGDSLISWNSCQQKMTALSSCESELMALTRATQEALALRKLARDILGKQPAVPIFEDNNSTLAVAAAVKSAKNLKHVARRHFFVQQRVAAGHIRMLRCPTAFMLADIFTNKALAPGDFRRLRYGLLRGAAPP